MFDSICINRQDLSTGNPLDLGFLAECLVFYQKVHVLADVETFKFLVRACGTDVLLELFAMGTLQIEFFDNQTGVRTFDQALPGERHDLVVFTANKNRFPQVSRSLVEEITGPSGKGLSKLLKRFSEHVSRSEYTIALLDEILTDLADQIYVSMAVPRILRLAAPEYKIPEPLNFRVLVGTDKFITVDTNIDFKAVNDSYHQHVSPSHSSLSASMLLAHLADTRRDINVASQHSADIALAPIRSVTAACKFAEILRPVQADTDIISLFHEAAFGDFPNIREAVNSGARNFLEVLKLVKAAQKFKDWLKEQPDSTDLRDAYCQEISHLDWADKTPTKIIRWLLMSGAGSAVDALLGGHAGTLGGLALSAADALLLDKLVKGWRPTQFIEGPLKQFLQGPVPAKGAHALLS
jgi:hypothetical protein